MGKPFSQACENNKHPILKILQTIFTEPCSLLEIGSGTGQHAVFFAENLPHITWQPTEMSENIEGFKLWAEEANLSNLESVVTLDVEDNPWPLQELEAVFTANTLHIMSWEKVEVLFDRLGECLQTNGKFCSYGPFNKDGKYTSDSNADFDLWLKQHDPMSGIRHIEDLVTLGQANGIVLLAVIAMPANNQCLIWQKMEA